jgi:NitT/TauT family transport system substrate-binding protein
MTLDACAAIAGTLTHPRQGAGLARTTLGLISVFVALGISQQPAVAQTKTAVTVRLSFTASPTHSGVIVAKAKGWYDEAGLDATIGEGTGSASTAQLLAAGNDTFGLVNTDVVIRSISTGSPLKIVAIPIADSAYGIACRADTGIKKPADLAGHGYFDSAFSTSYLQAPIFFRKTDVPQDKVNIQSVAASTLVPGIMSGRYDCIGAIESQISQYVISGQQPVFFKFSAYGVPQDGIALVANTNYIANHSDVVRKFVRASDRGYDWAIGHPDEMYPIMKGLFPNYSYTPETTTNALKVFSTLDKQQPSGVARGYIVPSSVTELSSMLETDFGVTNMPKPDQIYTNEFVEGP